VELYHNDKKIEWNEQNVYDQYHADVALSASDILYIWISDMEDCQGDDGAWRLLNSVFCIEPTDGATTTTTAISTVTGVIISGGWNGTHGIATTEVFFPSSSGSGHTCSLQSMPSTRYAHTLDQLGDGVLACGGGGGADTLKTCDRFDGTSWSRHSTLQYKRVHHNSLAGQDSLLLMGGQYQPSPTELVGGGQHQQYSLQQITLRACGITEPGSDNNIILTGGYYNGPRNTVALYGYNGFIGALPSLQIGRYGHGCGVLFVTGKKVFVVAGGLGPNSRYLDTTELLYDGGNSWVTGQALPRTLLNAASVSLADSVLLLGGSQRREILSFNSSLVWTEVGTLQQGRSYAAAGAVTFPRGHLDLSNCLK